MLRAKRLAEFSEYLFPLGLTVSLVRLLSLRDNGPGRTEPRRPEAVNSNDHMKTRLNVFDGTQFESGRCPDCPTRANGDNAPASSAGHLDADRIHKCLARPRFAPPPPMNHGLALAAAMNDSPEAATRLRTTVESSFNETAGRDEELFHHLEGDLVANQRGNSSEITRHEETLEGTDPFIEIPGDGIPWTVGEMAKVGSLWVVSLILLFVGILAIGTILVNSGIAGFEPGTVWPYLFSAVPAASAWGIKSMALGIGLQVWRRRLMVLILGVGALLVVLWSYLLVQTFGGGMTASLSDVVGAVVAGATGSSSAGGDTGKWLLFVGLVAESLLAGGLFMAIELICDRHHGPKTVPNPRYVPVREALLKCRAKQSAINELLGLVRGRLSEIAHGRAAYVGQAMTLYEAARQTIAHRAQLADFLKTAGLLPAGRSNPNESVINPT